MTSPSIPRPGRFLASLTAADGTVRRSTNRRALLPAVPAAATVGLQLAYPQVGGTGLRALTVASVCTFAAASITHAAVHRGGAYAARLLAVAGGLGLSVEVLGVRTGMPFGTYAYQYTLGPELLGVPVVIPLAWTMMAYPAAVVARRIARSRRGAVLIGAVALAAWDLFLDPQMVAAGHWVWASDGPALAGIPLTNYLGWLGTAAVMQALLQPGMPAADDDRVPVALYLWTWLGSVVAHAFYFDLPVSAVTGGLGMGAVALGLLRRAR